MKVNTPCHRFARCSNRSDAPSCCLQEEQNRGKPNWEHLSDELHVLITVEDSENRAAAKLQRAVDEIKKLLVPSVSELSTPV